MLMREEIDTRLGYREQVTITRDEFLAMCDTEDDLEAEAKRECERADDAEKLNGIYKAAIEMLLDEISDDGEVENLKRLKKAITHAHRLINA